jgi:hypothetical protein
MRLTNLSFEEWIEHSFSREVHSQQAAWYFDPAHDWWDPKPVEAVAYLITRLFEDYRAVSVLVFGRPDCGKASRILWEPALQATTVGSPPWKSRSRPASDA